MIWKFARVWTRCADLRCPPLWPPELSVSLNKTNERVSQWEAIHWDWCVLVSALASGLSSVSWFHSIKPMRGSANKRLVHPGWCVHVSPRQHWSSLASVPCPVCHCNVLCSLAGGAKSGWGCTAVESHWVGQCTQPYLAWSHNLKTATETLWSQQEKSMKWFNQQ